jgi:hypothetical protein
MRRVVLTLAAAAGIAIAFVVGGAWKDRASLLGALSRSAAAEGIVPIVEQLDAREAGSREAQAAESSDAQEEAVEPREAIEVAPEAPPPTAPETRPRQVRRPALWSAPRRSASADSLTPDDDATLPATEPSN